MAKAKPGGIYFKVSDEDRKLIEQKMALAGVHNMSAYIRKMCIDGYIINLQIPELGECSKYLRFASNNLNQIARRVNADGRYYHEDIKELIDKMSACCKLFGNIKEQLSKIK